MTLDERCQAIRLILSDVDGVLTDGGIVLRQPGDRNQAVPRPRRDGHPAVAEGGLSLRPDYASQFAHRQDAGGRIGHRDPAAGDRRQAGGHAGNPQELRLSPAQVCYIGDDLPDLPVVRAAGLGVAVADACAELRQAAHYVTTLPGGSGAVRETVELILKAQTRWEDLIQTYR